METMILSGLGTTATGRQAISGHREVPLGQWEGLDLEGHEPDEFTHPLTLESEPCGFRPSR